MVAVGSVGGADTVETMALHDTGEALALAGAGDVDLVACTEGVDSDKGLILLKGAIPGPKGGLVVLRSAAKRSANAEGSNAQ